jgi:uncharacterized protein
MVQVPYTFAQVQPQSVPTLNVTGRAKKLVMPDLAVFTVNMNATDKDEASAIKRMNELADITLGKLKKEGFTEQQIKLTGYSVNANYDYAQGGNARKISYTARQTVNVKFNLDKDRVLKLFNTLGGDQSGGVDVNFYTEASEALQKSIGNELVQQAIKDAKDKADMMAKAAGYNVKSVIDISYDVEQRMPPQPYYEKNMMRAEADNNQNYFTVNEMEFNESVRLTYRIDAQ